MFRIEEEVCSKQQQTIQQLEERISETQLHLDKEKVKYQGACRQHEVSITAKLLLSEMLIIINTGCLQCVNAIFSYIRAATCLYE